MSPVSMDKVSRCPVRDTSLPEHGGDDTGFDWDAGWALELPGIPSNRTSQETENPGKFPGFHHKPKEEAYYKYNKISRICQVAN